MLTKKKLRVEMRSRRGNKQLEDQQMVRLLLASPLLAHARRVFAFVPLPSEVDITPILDTCPIALPRCGKDGSMEFYAMGKNWREQGEKKELGVWEPSEGKLVHPDEGSVMLVPGIAFDRQGFRLGRGGGYYDRYLARFPQLVTVGVCHSWQLVERVPREIHDMPVTHLLAGSWIR
ncbi:MAG: 5-formyltetrahydrofolate cyclo-ligase [Sphaerochaetaceae bacterium]|nr:5-formyltetrahydrofolate cyclo-ligase [Spirochaetales bacterium]MDY5498970.1 5-formyltetrahydrofolate cyclo-ligase [Sphaerochaetaceae bacterium]